MSDDVKRYWCREGVMVAHPGQWDGCWSVADTMYVRAEHYDALKSRLSEAAADLAERTAELMAAIHYLPDDVTCGELQRARDAYKKHSESRGASETSGQSGQAEPKPTQRAGAELSATGHPHSVAAYAEKLRSALEKIIKISDRKHDAWDEGHALLDQAPATKVMDSEHSSDAVATAIQSERWLAEAAAADVARWYFVKHHVLLFRNDAGECRVFFGAPGTPHEENCTGKTIQEAVDAAMLRWPQVYDDSQRQGADSPYVANTDPSADQTSDVGARKAPLALQEATATPIAQSAPATPTCDKCPRGDLP